MLGLDRIIRLYQVEFQVLVEQDHYLADFLLQNA
jgi:hypothetical protein